jgi:hypothetical protein
VGSLLLISTFSISLIHFGGSIFVSAIAQYDGGQVLAEKQ